jgi:hypothetical protein
MAKRDYPRHLAHGDMQQCAEEFYETCEWLGSGMLACSSKRLVVQLQYYLIQKGLATDDAEFNDGVEQTNDPPITVRHFPLAPNAITPVHSNPCPTRLQLPLGIYRRGTQPGGSRCARDACGYR